ncbi:hypothetical protein OHAE_747 [Ochrobactrum soli]|uniref:Uncharacterized protein n=1 Tax=Ochrobactrum soli TaxID=2448455 RepID=A0A2P9HM00_9HYPH|nr:hypothetical protein OHAE_747 [[Ochrobactrum] soli]
MIPLVRGRISNVLNGMIVRRTNEERIAETPQIKAAPWLPYI